MIRQADGTATPVWLKVGIFGLILVLLVSGLWFFKAQQSEQRMEVEDRLLTIAKLKVKQIAGRREERLADAAVLMERKALIESVRHFISTPGGQDGAEILRRLRPIKERYHFADILVVDPEAHVRMSLKPGTTDFCQGYVSTLHQAIAGRKPLWSPLHRDTAYPLPHHSVVVPLFSGPEDHGYVGALVLINDATQFLYPLIQSWPTPSHTSETLLIRKDGEDVLFLNELRHQKETALKLRIPVTRADLPAAMAVAGKQGIVEGKDYRGVKVVAAILPIPDSRWFMVAKVDAAEAFAEWRFRSLLILALMMGAIGIVLVAGFVLWQHNLKVHYRAMYRSEGDLRRVMEHHRITLQAIGDAVIATDAKGRVEIVNPVAEALTGWSQEEAVGRALKDVFRIINEETRKTVEDPVARVLKEGVVVGLANHTLLIAKDGREIPIADSGAPIRDESKEMIGVVLVFRDQTEERRAQRFIETRLSLIEYAADHTLDEFVTWALDKVCNLVGSPIGFYHILDPNRNPLSPQWGSTRTRKECGLSDGGGMHDDIQRAGVWADCLRKREPVIYNDYASLPHKKELPEGHADLVRLLAVPVLREDKVVAVLGVGNKQVEYTQPDVEIASFFADLTWEIVSHKQAEESLRYSLEKYEKTFQAAPIWVVLSSIEDGRYLEVNEAFLKTIGYGREEVIGKTSLELGIWDNPEDRERIVAHIKDRGGVRNQEVRRRTRSGEVIDTLFSAESLFLDGRQVMISVSQDITERKRAEEDRDKLHGQLLQAQKMESVGRLAGGVAHDFNNMLSVILGHTEMALSQVAPQDLIYSSLQEILKATKRSADITRQLLAFARKQTIDPKVLDLNDTVEGMLKMFRRLIGEDIDLAWKPAISLWPVKLDPAQVNQILANLCVNARDAIDGVGKVTIETRNVDLDEAYCSEHGEFLPGEYIMMAVSDDGCGMDKKTMSNIFEPFFTTKELGKGTGLGLPMVYGIVKQNQGFINVYSEPGKGSCFKIYIPRYMGEAKEAPEGAADQLPRARGETVLIVEDETSVLKAGTMILERLGYTVLAAGGPEEALETVRTYPDKIHLLMTDVVMPVMSGKDLAGEITKLRPDIKILFMSGYTADAIVHHGILAKGVNFIHKPFTIGTLTRKVRELLDKAG